jgi:phosphopantothenoylcysteine decarboxylase/phosphopantothenate--cysteine ligase
MTLQGKHLVVGIGGGIAAFKAVALVRELMRRGAELRVVMTQSATRFVGPITFAGLTGRPAVTDLWAQSYAGEVHVELGAWADAMVIAPATMNLMARAAGGQADDAVLATLACSRGPVFFAPAMHERMWSQPATRANVATLQSRGAIMLGPVTGELASGEVGEGRMMEPEDMANAIEAELALPRRSNDLQGKRILITAGPTYEDLDPVRFLGNRSTGRMGYAIAACAARRGAEVILVSGPVQLDPPTGVERVSVRSAREMHAAVMQRFESCDVAVMAAAVADYRPEEAKAEKIKKAGKLQLSLVRNPDILADIGRQRSARPEVLVGFALETQDLEASARAKLSSKKADLIVANEASDGLGGDTNRAILVDERGCTALPKLSKQALADEILDRIGELLVQNANRLKLGADAPSGDPPN